MSESKYLFERVKRTATKAIDAERAGNLATAFDFYLQAADLLNQLIALEKSQKIRDSYYIKAKEYIGKAKEIKILQSSSKQKTIIDEDTFEDLSKDDLPSPPKPEVKKDTSIPPPPPPEERKIPPSPPENLTGKMMRGEDTTEERKSPSLPPPPQDSIKKTPPPPETKSPPPPPPPKEKIQLPSKTTYELLFDEGKYRECIIECTKSVEAELRVRMGLFDEQLTLGMLIERGLAKGMESLKDFKFVNILFNRIEHENYRPSQADAEKAITITTKILIS